MRVGQVWKRINGEEKRPITKVQNEWVWYLCKNCKYEHRRTIKEMEEFFFLEKDVDEEEIL